MPDADRPQSADSSPPASAGARSTSTTVEELLAPLHTDAARARSRANRSLVLLALQPLLFFVFLLYGFNSIPMGGNQPDGSSMRSATIVAAIGCVVAVVGSVVAVASVRTRSSARGWTALVLNALVALMAGMMAFA